MFWKLVLRAAIAIGKSDWAKAYAKQLIEKLRHDFELRLHGIADTAGIALPPVSDIRQGRIVRTRFDTLKPDMVILVDGERLRISRLISSSATETVYEAAIVP